ncbi:MAG: hypothetical protein NVSMB38_41310 [Ktedonobacteraceae bacterium]
MSKQPSVPGGPFDSNIIGCVWHRLLLDAQFPQGTDIVIRARAADDPALLPLTNWVMQPTPYLRSDGAEIPYYNPWRDMQPLPERTGTWEVLFQEIRGRYLQLELSIRGTGRSTPAIRALRAWYPRFSYLDHYFPAIYREDPLPASFLERWLANFEGMYTTLEDKIEHIAELFDARTAPAETLEWLACWFGLLLDPLWDEQRRRVLIRNIDQLYRRRGTPLGVEIAVRLYVDSHVDDSLFDPRCFGTGSVRILEQFLSRGTDGMAYGDPTAMPTSEGEQHCTAFGNPKGLVEKQGDRKGLSYMSGTHKNVGETLAVSLFPPKLTPQVAAESAHRFTVLVPHDLDDQDLEMVRRIITLEKPAHTAFALNRYWDFFHVGAARIGHDTQLGESNQYAQLLLGDTYLGDNYLDVPYPENLTERIVFNRDNLGNLPGF